MRNRIYLLMVIMTVGACLAMADTTTLNDTSYTDNFNLWQGDEQGLQLSKPATRGQVRATEIKLGNLLLAKIDTVEDIVTKKITEINSVNTDYLRNNLDTIRGLLAETDRKADEALSENTLNASDIKNTSAQIGILQKMIERLKEQMAFVMRANREEIQTAAKDSLSEIKSSHPWWSQLSVANYQNTNASALSVGYDFDYVQPDYVATISPQASLGNNNLMLGLTGTVRFGSRP